ncbi:MAG: WG repeat-containing protein [Crocinitomicaceae bacterium]|nr:WG repeat-containing protein [Crocinitomicaceae bacterium]
MKKIFFLSTLFIAASSFAQNAVIFEENGKFGLKTDFGKELLPAEYEKITKCRTDTLDFYIADYVGSSELYSYNSKKRDIYEETAGKNFSVIKFTWNVDLKSDQFYGYTDVGRKYHFKGNTWEQMKVKGMIGCKDETGKYAVCMDGKALTDYTYNDVDARHKNLAVVLTDTGWVALDAKMKSHYNWAFDEIRDSDIHPEAFVIKREDKWGIMSLDGSMNLPPSEIKNPQGMFDFDGAAYAELERSYAVKRGGKWGVVNEKNEVNVPFKYDNAYMIDDFAIEQHDLEVHAVVQDGENWKFMGEKWKEIKSVQFDEWLGVHGNVALVKKGDKVAQLDLKTFKMTNDLYFGEYDDFQIIKTEDATSGVVAKNGDIILPFEFSWIAIEGDDDDEFFVAEKGGKDGIYSLDGKNLVPHMYEGLIFLEKKSDKNYFSVGRAGEAALAYWDTETNKMVLLTRKMYKNVSYHFGDKKFTAETFDGVYHVLDDEGRLMMDE